MNSLDPRVARLPEAGTPGVLPPRTPLDQLGTFEVFVQPKAGKPFQHEGAVHAPNLEMAFLLAKETFTRRFTCISLCVAETPDVTVSQVAEGTVSAYDLLPAIPDGKFAPQSYEIYHQPKRGKQPILAGTVSAGNPIEAMHAAKEIFGKDKAISCIWAIPAAAIHFTAPEENDLWLTLPDKKFRDAAEYKGGDRLKNFVEAGNFSQKQ